MDRAPLFDGVLDRVPGERVRIGDLVDLLGQKAHGTLLLLLAMPNLIPIPIVPASTTITGALIVLVGMQLVTGRHALWLPGRVRGFELARSTAHRWLERADALTGRLVPRRTAGLECPDDDEPTGRMIFCGVGLLAVVHGVILALPIPFANMIPALAVASFGAGLARAHRRPLAIGVGLTLLTALVLLGVSSWLAHTFRAHRP